MRGVKYASTASPCVPLVPVQVCTQPRAHAGKEAHVAGRHFALSMNRVFTASHSYENQSPSQLFLSETRAEHLDAGSESTPRSYILA